MLVSRERFIVSISGCAGSAAPRPCELDWHLARCADSEAHNLDRSTCGLQQTATVRASRFRHTPVRLRGSWCDTRGSDSDARLRLASPSCCCSLIGFASAAFSRALHQPLQPFSFASAARRSRTSTASRHSATLSSAPAPITLSLLSDSRLCSCALLSTGHSLARSQSAAASPLFSAQ